MNTKSRVVLIIVGCIVVFSAAALSAAAQAVIDGGGVGPAYGLNVNPPRPVNAAGVAVGRSAYGVVNTDNLFLRQGDSTDYAPIGILDGGTELILIGTNGQSGNNFWWYVEVGGLRGWAKGEFIALRGDASDLPIVTARGTFTPASFYIGGENWLYSAPDYGSQELCLLPGNLFYVVIGQDRNASPDFYQITGACDTGAVLTGWIPAPNGILRNTAGLSIPVTQ